MLYFQNTLFNTWPYIKKINKAKKRMDKKNIKTLKKLGRII